MKQIIRLGSLVLILMIGIACGDNEQNDSVPTECADIMNLSTSEIVMGETGGTQSVTFDATSDWSVSVVESDVAWLTLSPTEGTRGKSEIIVNVQANDFLLKRYATILIRCGIVEKIIKLKQDAQKEVLDVSLSSVEVESSGKEFIVMIESNVDYTIASDVDWITIVESRSITKNNIQVLVHANESFEQRQGILTISGNGIEKTILVIQSANEKVLNVDLSSVEVDSSGQDFVITVESNIDYTVTSDVDWITIVESRSITKNNIQVSVHANDSFEQRQGILTISGNDIEKTILVTQLANKKVLNVDLSSVEVDSSGKDFLITVESNIDYTVTSDVDWITIVESRSITKNQIQASVRANESFNQRQGILTISGHGIEKTILVTQLANEKVLNVDLSSIEVESSGKSFVITVESNIDYTVTSEVDWITIVESRSITKNQIQLSVSANQSFNSRKGSLVISGEGLTRTVSVLQAANEKELVVSPESVNMTASGGVFSLVITSNITYEIKCDATWIHVPDNYCANSGNVVVSVDKNLSTSERSASLVISDNEISKTIIIKQNGRELPLGDTESFGNENQEW